MKLTSTLEKNANYKIYADNLFISVPLLESFTVVPFGTISSEAVTCQMRKSFRKKGEVHLTIELKISIMLLLYGDMTTEL